MSNDIYSQLQKVLGECERLRAENKILSQKLGITVEEIEVHEGTGQNEKHIHEAAEPKIFSTDQKVALFRSYFRGREDVYALRWESKDGKKGYSPACSHDWDCLLCFHDRKAKRSRCENRKFLPMTDQVMWNHLSGKKTVGIYPLLVDETCWFLAVDFDKESWLEDVRAFLEVCREQDIDCLLERSRSGRGGHVLIFFETSIAASLARRLGSFLLTKTMEKRHQVGLDSYDRLFPNQDTMPKGGFGNLIALPLQREPRSRGNSVFIDENGNFHEDQWVILSKVRKITAGQIHKILASFEFHAEIGEISLISDDDGTPAL